MTWRNVHSALEARRLELDLLKGAWYTRLGTSETTYRKMAEGIPVTKVPKRRQISRAAGWTPESIDDILAGREPTLMDSVSPPADELVLLRVRVARLEKMVETLQEISDRRAALDPDWLRAPSADER